MDKKALADALPHAQDEIDEEVAHVGFVEVKGGRCGVEGCEHGFAGQCEKPVRICEVDQKRFHPNRRDHFQCGEICRYRKYRAKKAASAGKAGKHYGAIVAEWKRTNDQDLAVAEGLLAKAVQHDNEATSHQQRAASLRKRADTIKAEVAGRKQPMPGAPLFEEKAKPVPTSATCPECGHTIKADPRGNSAVFFGHDRQGRIEKVVVGQRGNTASYCEGSWRVIGSDPKAWLCSERWHCTKACGKGPWNDGKEPDSCPCGGNLLFAKEPPKGPSAWRPPRRSAREQAKRRR